MLDVAIDAAKRGGDLAYRYFKTQPKVSYKPDNSPVTKADIEVEKLIRKIISKKFPDHGIIGEELPPINPKTKYQWVIDPIDGTKQFIRDMPFWGTLLAVLENNKPIIGITYFPVFDEFAVAQKNKGSYLNDKKVRVSKISDISHSYMIHGAIDRFEKFGKVENLLNLSKICEGRRGYGDAYGYNLIITGKADIMLEGSVYIQDVAATSLLVEEADGKFTDFNGKFSLTSGNAIATNGILHEQVLKILNS